MGVPLTALLGGATKLMERHLAGREAGEERRRKLTLEDEEREEQRALRKSQRERDEAARTKDLADASRPRRYEPTTREEAEEFELNTNPQRRSQAALDEEHRKHPERFRAEPRPPATPASQTDEAKAARETARLERRADAIQAASKHPRTGKIQTDRATALTQAAREVAQADSMMNTAAKHATAPKSGAKGDIDLRSSARPRPPEQIAQNVADEVNAGTITKEEAARRFPAGTPVGDALARLLRASSR